MSKEARSVGRVETFDVLFVGAGLASGLGALALHSLRPDLRVGMVERDARPGGNHTWCFHAADCPEAARRFVDPLVEARWPGYEVQFPRRRRRLASAYACISSERLAAALAQAAAAPAGLTLRLGADVAAVGANQVTLADGTALAAKLVLDARGPDTLAKAVGGYQKFVGLELAVAPGHPLREPVLMDACVPQTDGFRFIYALPLAPDRVLVEDTFFADGPTLDDAASERGLLAYAQGLGLTVRQVLRRERGVLPLPFARPTVGPARSPVRIGYGGGLFHPITGYSFPMAVRAALALTRVDLHDTEHGALAQCMAQVDGQLGFLCFLTRTLFQWFAPEDRYGVLEHFYRLPEALIARFYAAELTSLDRLRMFMGAPPRGLRLLRNLGLPREVMP
jgi:lycopene beta-cyclase